MMKKCGKKSEKTINDKKLQNSNTKNGKTMTNVQMCMTNT